LVREVRKLFKAENMDAGDLLREVLLEHKRLYLLYLMLRNEFYKSEDLKKKGKDEKDRARLEPR